MLIYSGIYIYIERLISV